MVEPKDSQICLCWIHIPSQDAQVCAVRIIRAKALFIVIIVILVLMSYAAECMV
jgi:hypothetical protein